MGLSLCPVCARSVAAGAALVAAILWWLTQPETRYISAQTSDGTMLVLALADLPAQRAVGLSTLDRIPSDGMLLTWPAAGVHPIWMSKMRFALDVVWCDAHGQVIAVEQNLPPCSTDTECPLYGTQVQNALHVLELPANTAASAGLRVGAHITLLR